MLRISHSIKFCLLIVGCTQSLITFQMSVCVTAIEEETNPGNPNFIIISQLSFIYLLIFFSLTVPSFSIYILNLTRLQLQLNIREMLTIGLNIITKLSMRMVSTLHNKNLYGFSSEQNDYGVKFDEEQIKKKMRQIKERKEGGCNKKDGKLQFMNIGPTNDIMRKVRKYRQSTSTENLLQFTDPSVEQKPTTLQITGYDQNCIEVDSMVYPPSMIIFKNQLLIWEVLNIQQIKKDDFIILKYVTPKPTYVIVGVNNPNKFPRDIHEFLRKSFDSFDVLQIFEAVSQYNVIANDDINVAAFLLTK